ncbi:MAG: 4-(cytidine 5'-diphospho)-2-C-methyl-D-erythritol kinase [Actinobacteria bacterium]|jgi:4-diphosphocytidyl-2-C-methyl-D-erythritol kinase|nr:4-(cytidine 5'-diphospho)-2-C-methyl-D-erythritol kinase [Actinomycetota bacterium]
MIRARTNAKLNLFLRVVGKRPDGYHEIETVLHGIGLADDIAITPTETGTIEVDMVLEPPLTGDLPAMEDNLVWTSARRLEELGALSPGVRIEITKRIPMGAGLGGGSGNAAGVLVLLNELWEAGYDEPRLLDIAGGLGSDVPYCIGGGTVLAAGRGEKLTRLPAPKEIWFVLGLTATHLSTRDVYERWEEAGSPSSLGSAPMVLALGGGTEAEIAGLLHNDLESPAFSMLPELRNKKQALLDAGSLGALLSGSGPTMYGVATDRAHAERIAAQVEDDFDRVLVVNSRPTCLERLNS